jgi:Lar family restriction alleviation protein
MSDDVKLKPCPFCGRPDEDIEISQEFSHLPFYVECPCGCMLFTEALSIRGAIEAWNRRVQS